MKLKIAVVTGANKGLGLAIVKGLCGQYDGKVYLTARDERRGQESCKELNRLGLAATFHQLDISNDESIARFIGHLNTINAEVEILVNNAGILFLKDSTETKLYQAEKTLEVNFFSLVKFTEAILPLVTFGGKIVNISSSSGHLSRLPSETLRRKISSQNLTLDELNAFMNTYIDYVRRREEAGDVWGQSPYVVSKIGVNAYTFILHRRLSPQGIMVNCVHPGYVISDMTAGAGSVLPEVAAELPLRLALQPKGSGLYFWHNGATVPWDGPDPRGYIDAKN